MAVCPECNGRGQVFNAIANTHVRCDYCGGTGFVPDAFAPREASGGSVNARSDPGFFNWFSSGLFFAIIVTGFLLFKTGSGLSGEALTKVFAGSFIGGVALTWILRVTGLGRLIGALLRWALGIAAVLGALYLLTR